ncbi:MAG TPA: hypothetical protein VIW69_03675 [Candidatus Elarobacter sp.]
MIPPCSDPLIMLQSHRRIVHSDRHVKSWAEDPPSCEAARPACCIACGAASRPAGAPLVVVGHGVRIRTMEGPLEPGAAPRFTELLARRYACRACGAIMVVVPRGVGRGYRYTLAAIAWALSLWSHAGQQAAEVRAQTSTVRQVGAASASRWASLRRWTASARSLFGVSSEDSRTVRQRAARVASFVAAHALVSTGSVPRDAFYGACFCPPH